MGLALKKGILNVNAFKGCCPGSTQAATYRKEVISGLRLLDQNPLIQRLSFY